MDSRRGLAGAPRAATAQIHLGSGNEGSLSASRWPNRPQSGGAVQRRNGLLRHRGHRESDAPPGAVARELRPADRRARAAAFEEIADFYGARERLVVRLDAFAQIGGSALTDERIAVPEWGEALRPQAGIPNTYVPFRNAHFLSAAVSWAEVIGASRRIHRSRGGRQFRLSGLPPGVLPRIPGSGAAGDAPGNTH